MNALEILGELEVFNAEAYMPDATQLTEFPVGVSLAQMFKCSICNRLVDVTTLNLTKCCKSAARKQRVYMEAVDRVLASPQVLSHAKRLRRIVPTHPPRRSR